MIITADIKTLETISIRKSVHEEHFDILAEKFAKATLQTWKGVKANVQTQTTSESKARYAL